MKVNTAKPVWSALNSKLLAIAVSPKEWARITPKKQSKKAKRPVKRSEITLEEADSDLGGGLLAKLKNEGFEAKHGQVSLLNFPKDGILQSLLVFGISESSSSKLDQLGRFRDLGGTLLEYARKLNLETVALGGELLKNIADESLSALLEGIHLTTYKFQRYSSKKNESKFEGIKELTILTQKRLPASVISESAVLCSATDLARDLVNTAPSDCTPKVMVEQAKKVAKEGRLSIKIFDRAALKKLGAQGILGVSRGSEEPPFLVKLGYAPKGRSKSVVSIVGKGVTFDSGGLSIKTADSMETMKYDMAGAACVIGVMKAVAVLKPKVEVRAYIALTENMISGKAIHPGDVLTALNGKTIEVLNTDAEGRLILADALSLAERDGCDVIIDLATLTGACMVALGLDYAGLFSTDDTLSGKIIEAGAISGERFWRMPLAAEYREMIKSPIADIKNIGGRWGGAITAALFLKEFVAKTPWAHLDIAGPAYTEKEKGHLRRGGVGFGVRTVTRYITSLKGRK